MQAHRIYTRTPDQIALRVISCDNDDDDDDDDDGRARQRVAVQMVIMIMERQE